jgi:hypothetical protein
MVAAFAACLAAFSLAACSGAAATGLDQMIYNATYSGPATLRLPVPLGGGALAPAQPLTLTMTLSQLGQDFSGTFAITDTLARSLYSGSVTGRSTSAGADFTLVVPPPCAGALYGSFSVSNGQLTGSAAGRDCGVVAVGNNIRITFTNLVRH